MSEVNGSSCPRCGSVGERFSRCMRCGADLADSGTLSTPVASQSRAPDEQLAVSPTGPGPRQDFDPSTQELAALERNAAARAASSSPSGLSPPGVGLARPVEQPAELGSTPAPALSGARRGKLVVAAVAAAVLLPALGWWLFGGSGDVDRQEADIQETQVPAATSSGSPSASPSSLASPSTAVEEPAAQWECWNDKPAATARGCGRPRGVAGMAWVFAGFDSRAESCGPEGGSHTGGTWVTAWLCELELANGREARFHFAEDVGVAAARAVYTDYYDGAAPRKVREGGTVVRYVWGPTYDAEDGYFESSSLYVGHPWSVTVEARSKAGVLSAMNEVVGFRPAAQIAGVAPKG
jgi:hypothetical protein